MYVCICVCNCACISACISERSDAPSDVASSRACESAASRSASFSAASKARWVARSSSLYASTLPPAPTTPAGPTVPAVPAVPSSRALSTARCISPLHHTRTSATAAFLPRAAARSLLIHSRACSSFASWSKYRTSAVSCVARECRCRASSSWARSVSICRPFSWSVARALPDSAAAWAAALATAVALSSSSATRAAERASRMTTAACSLTRCTSSSFSTRSAAITASWSRAACSLAAATASAFSDAALPKSSWRIEARSRDTSCTEVAASEPASESTYETIVEEGVSGVPGVPGVPAIPGVCLQRGKIVLRCCSACSTCSICPSCPSCPTTTSCCMASSRRSSPDPFHVLVHPRGTPRAKAARSSCSVSCFASRRGGEVRMMMIPCFCACMIVPVLTASSSAPLCPCSNCAMRVRAALSCDDRAVSPSSALSSSPSSSEPVPKITGQVSPFLCAVPAPLPPSAPLWWSPLWSPSP